MTVLPDAPPRAVLCYGMRWSGGGAWPVQYEAEHRGTDWYLRFRHGRLSIGFDDGTPGWMFGCAWWTVDPFNPHAGSWTHSEAEAILLLVSREIAASIRHGHDVADRLRSLALPGFTITKGKATMDTQEHELSNAPTLADLIKPIEEHPEGWRDMTAEELATAGHSADTHVGRMNPHGVFTAVAKVDLDAWKAKQGG